MMYNTDIAGPDAAYQILPLVLSLLPSHHAQWMRQRLSACVSGTVHGTRPVIDRLQWPANVPHIRRCAPPMARSSLCPGACIPTTRPARKAPLPGRYFLQGLPVQSARSGRDHIRLSPTHCIAVRPSRRQARTLVPPLPAGARREGLCDLLWPAGPRLQIRSAEQVEWSGQDAGRRVLQEICFPTQPGHCRTVDVARRMGRTATEREGRNFSAGDANQLSLRQSSLVQCMRDPDPLILCRAGSRWHWRAGCSAHPSARLTTALLSGEQFCSGSGFRVRQSLCGSVVQRVFTCPAQAHIAQAPSVCKHRPPSPGCFQAVLWSGQRQVVRECCLPKGANSRGPASRSDPWMVCSPLLN